MYFEIGTVAENLLIVKALCDLYGKKFKFSLAMFAYQTIMITDMCLIEYDLLPKWTCLFCYMAMIGYCISSFKPKIKVLIINIVLLALTLSGLQVFSGFILYLCLGNPVDDKKEICMVHLLTFLVYQLFSKIVSMEKVARFFQKGYVLLNAALGGGFTVLVVLMVRSKITERYEAFFDTSMIVVIGVGILFAVNYMRLKEKTIEDEAKLLTYELYADSYEKLIGEIRSRQHDFIHHISAIENMHFVCHDYDSLVSRQKEYCEEMLKENRHAGLLRLGDSVLIGFLYGKLLEMEQKGIEAEYDIETAESVFRIPDYRLIEIAGNFINNAMEELERQPVKKLYIGFFTDDTHAHLRVENTAEFLAPDMLHKLFQKGFSRKGTGRGLGLYHVKKLSEEYGFEILCGNQERDGRNYVYFEIKQLLTV